MRVRTITRINAFNYGIFTHNSETKILLQRLGDRGWIAKEEVYSSPEEAISEIKRIEKEHYDAIKFANSKTKD
jgi:hypothetical protein